MIRMVLAPRVPVAAVSEGTVGIELRVDRANLDGLGGHEKVLAIRFQARVTKQPPSGRPAI